MKLFKGYFTGTFLNERVVLLYSKERPGLLFLTIFVWIAYGLCAIIFGFSAWFVKLLSLAAIVLSGVLLFYIKKHIEHRNESQG